MMHVSLDFMAIPKFFEWPEDLEEGIYSKYDRIQWTYNAQRDEFIVYVDVIKESINTDGSRTYECTLDEHHYPRDLFYIFVKGELWNGKVEPYTSNGD